MGAVISNLKARFGVETSDFKKGLKDGEKAVDDFKGAAGNSIAELASLFGINMGAVNEAIGTARKSMNFFHQSQVAAAGGANKLSIALKVLKVALLATGVGALVVALSSVVVYFTKSGEGADKFAKIMMQIRSAIDTVVERLVRFGGGLVDIFSGKFRSGWEQMKTAFQGIGKELVEDWKHAGALADAEDALEDREIGLINSLEERRAKVAELRRQAREELEDNKKKLTLLGEAEKLIKSVYGDEIGLEQERLRIMKEKLALQTSDPTDEQRREVAEQEAKINSLLRAQSEELKALLREKNSAIKALEKEVELEEEKEALFGKLVKAATPATKGKLFDLEAISTQLATVRGAVTDTMTALERDLVSSVNGAFESLATGLGEFLGELVIGETGIQGFGQMVAGVFADMAIQVGKIAIATGMATLGIKAALESLNPAVAIAAGIALVALGTAVKGALSKAAGGGSASTASAAASGGYSYDTRNIAGMKQEIEITGKLTADGRDLAYVFSKEDQRIKSTTGGLRR